MVTYVQHSSYEVWLELGSKSDAVPLVTVEFLQRLRENQARLLLRKHGDIEV